MEEHIWELVRTFAAAAFGRIFGDYVSKAVARRADRKTSGS
jgi:hypothetical protein